VLLVPDPKRGTFRRRVHPPIALSRGRTYYVWPATGTGGCCDHRWQLTAGLFCFVGWLSGCFGRFNLNVTASSTSGDLVLFAASRIVPCQIGYTILGFV
jgi:hypothetical protein